MDARPDVLNHNTETVPRLYRQVRLGARYERSLDMLAHVKRVRPETPTKSGLMLGLGEKIDEVLVNEYELQRAGETKDYFTIHPEYRVPPGTSHYPVGTEYTSANTRRLTSSEEIGALLDRVGLVEYYI